MVCTAVLFSCSCGCRDNERGMQSISVATGWDSFSLHCYSMHTEPCPLHCSLDSQFYNGTCLKWSPLDKYFVTINRWSNCC